MFDDESVSEERIITAIASGRDNIQEVDYAIFESSVFNQIQIMTKAECNLKCGICPNKYMEQTKKLLDPLVYSKIIDELSEINYDKRITLYLMNDPFTDERIYDFISEAKEKCPNARINISTNGVLPSY